MEVNLPFLLCFTLYLRAISKYKPPGAYIWRGDLTEGFLRYRFGGAYIWRGLFSEFYGNRVKFDYHFLINYDLNLQTAGFLALGLCDFDETLFNARH